MGSDSNSSVKDLDDASFDEQVLRSERPVLLAFYSAWSPACESVQGNFYELAEEIATLARVFRVSVDDNPDISALYDVRTIPTLLCVVHGREKLRLVGTCTKEAALTRLRFVLQGAGGG